MNPGWLKLHRRLLTWEWYTDSNTLRLFLHFLLTANYEVQRWQGIVIQPGQLLIGRRQLAFELKLTEQEIRTSIRKLESTNEITKKSTNRYSIVTICNWDDYQNTTTSDQPASQPATQQTINHQSTTIKEGKERKEEKNKIPAAFCDFFEKYPGTKRGILIEYEDFIKKNMPDILPLLLPGLVKELKHRELLRANKKFEPNWKNLSTWINNRCWEQELPEIKEKNTDGRPIRPSKQHAWNESQQKWIVL